jgi:hypothetical protein
VTYISRNLDNVLIGKYWGPIDLGYYTRAYFLMQLPGMLAIGLYSNIVIPAMSMMHQREGSMEAVYVLWLRRIALTICPIAAGMAGASNELVGVLYGHSWQPVVPILLWLSIAGVLQPIHNTAGWIYIAGQRGRGMLSMGIVVAITSVASFIIGLPQGPVEYSDRLSSPGDGTPRVRPEYWTQPASMHADRELCGCNGHNCRAGKPRRYSDRGRDSPETDRRDLHRHRGLRCLSSNSRTLQL